MAVTINDDIITASNVSIKIITPIFFNINEGELYIFLAFK